MLGPALAVLFTAQLGSTEPRALKTGILLLAHGGNTQWNQAVEKLRQQIDSEVPAELALGMADVTQMQKAIDRLEQRGIDKIVTVPLFVNSASEVLDQTRYALGLRKESSLVYRQAMERMAGSSHHGGHHGHSLSLRRVKTFLPVVMTPALDSHPLVAEILFDRARALSRNPSRETVILVGHGPVDEQANEIWLKTIRGLANKIKEKGKFRNVHAATIRDDSPKKVKSKAAENLRKIVLQSSKNGEVIIIPHLIARGGIEDHITEILKGLPYRWDGETLLPHHNLRHWVIQTARFKGVKR